MKRAGGWTLSVLTVLVTAVSILRVPPVNRLSAIPVHAKTVYSNREPDWFLSFFSTLGHRGDDFSRVWNRDFQWLEQRPLAVATVPFGGPGQRDTWVAVSELDGVSALALRWRLMLFPPEGVSAARSYAVWMVWRFEHSSLPSWAKVRFAVTENLLICSVSADSRDIYRLLDVADGRALSKKER